MSRTERRRAFARRAVVTGAVVTAVALFLAGCSGAPDAEGTEPVEQAVPDTETGAPEECGTAFPHAMGIPDPAEVESLPADWPEPPAGSTLCLTASALGDGGESLSYATEASADAVLAHYEDALAGYAVWRETAPTGGEMLAGDGETVSFQVRAGDGTIVIALLSAE